MLTLYPSNQLEYHVEALQVLLRTIRQHPMQPITILVENKAMQHWLQMELAKRSGIVMQLQFYMPSTFLWDTARQVLDGVPTQSAYRRDVLRWRIDQLLTDESVHSQPLYAQLVSYWQQQDDPATLRFELASELADLFEQYLMFRPDELHRWQTAKPEHWQADLWQRLVEQDSNHPLELQKQLRDALDRAPLPAHLILFGINHMPPQTLALFQSLAERIELHLFHLNPCFEYWGDIRTDKQRSKDVDEDDPFEGNPLLANLGQQGKDFFRRLQDSPATEINLPADYLPDRAPASVLQRLQQDILTFTDGRQTPVSLQDDSIKLVSCHSQLREVQVLHDWLLHQFEQDPELTARDVLVLCPAVEDYAPYVHAVFRSVYSPYDHAEPRLPSTVADRAPLDADPLVAAYMDLLTLPDSRFTVSSIVSYLKLPAIAQRFDIDQTEVQQLSMWLSDACIHWGIDGEHSRQQLANPNTQLDDRFTWQWGLQRLLLGFAQGDHEQIFTTGNGPLHLLPDVEGEQALLLGKLMHLLERLQYYSQALATPCDADQWQQKLLALTEQFYHEQTQGNDSIELIISAINELHQQLVQADYRVAIPLTLIRRTLQKRFTQADNFNQFLTGAVTFSSMVPMRSIPFKVIAILGLNDGQFPRQSQASQFDVLELGRRSGDRSRRQDDRYLFLESLISARQTLYLSYIGRSITNNQLRQPSLVLQELTDYLQQAYQWPAQNNDLIQQQPLHAFSRASFTPPQSSFDHGWLRLSQPVEQPGSERLPLEPLPLPEQPLELDSIANAFKNPLAYFAQQRLRLYLKEPAPELDDNEPFSIDTLSQYQLKQALLEDKLTRHDSDYIHTQLLAGRLPREGFSQPELAKLDQDLDDFAERVRPAASQVTMSNWHVSLNMQQQQIQLKSRGLSNDDTLVFYRPARRNGKDLFTMWLHYLLAIVDRQRPMQALLFCTDLKKILHLDNRVLPEQAQQHLQTILHWYQQISCRPLPLYAELGKALFDGKSPADNLQDARQKWQTTLNGQSPLDRAGYLQWFYGNDPVFEQQDFDAHQQLYRPLYQQLNLLSKLP